MKIIVSPIQGGEVIECDSMEAVHAACKRLHNEYGVTDFRTTRVDVVCDFCSHPEIVRLYKCRPAQMYTVEENNHTVHHVDSDGLWGACPECHAILLQIVGFGVITPFVKEMIGNLAGRALENAQRMMPEVPPALLAMTIVEAHSSFLGRWDRKPGDPIITDAELLGGGN